MRRLRPTFAALAILALLLLPGIAPATAAPAATLAGATVSGPAAAHQGESGAWTCDTTRGWQLGDRFGAWSPNSASLGAPLPPGYVAAISIHPQQRYFSLTLYSGRYGDLTLTVPFATLATEPGTVLPTGRPDFVGDPSLFFNVGPSTTMIEVVIGGWDGGDGSGDQGDRIYTWCSIAP